MVSFPRLMPLKRSTGFMGATVPRSRSRSDVEDVADALADRSFSIEGSELWEIILRGEIFLGNDGEVWESCFC